MSSFALCTNFKCLRRSFCMRYRAIPDSSHQTYAEFDNGNGEKCSYHMSNLGWPESSMIPTGDADTRNKR